MTGPIIIFAPGMTAGIPVQNIPNVSVQPTISQGGTLTTEQAIEQGLKELEQQNAETQNANLNSQAAITAENQYTGIDTATENFYPKSTGTQGTTLDNQETEYPTAFIRFQKNAQYPVTLANGAVVNVPLVATNTPAGSAPTAPTEPAALSTSITVTYNQDKNGNISSVGSGSGKSITISAGNTWHNDVRPTLRRKDGRNLGGVISDFQKYIDDMDDNASTNKTNAENYATALGTYNSALEDYNIKVKIQQGVDAVAQAAAQAVLDKNDSGFSGNYTVHRDNLLNALQATGISDPRGLENAFREFYISADLTPPETSKELYQETPYERLGDERDKFNSDYYEDQEAFQNLENGPKQQWQQIVNTDDVDMLYLYGVEDTTQRAANPSEKYNPTNFYRNDYRIRSNAGENVRGNPVYNILEYGQKNELGEFVKPAQMEGKGIDFVTDSDIQNARNLSLGVGQNDEENLIKELLNREGQVYDQLRNQFNLATSGTDENWNALRDQYTWEDGIPLYELNADKPVHFLNLLRLASLDSESQLGQTTRQILNDLKTEDETLENELRTTDAEEIINTFVSDESRKEIRKFGALTEDALSKTLEEIQRQRAEETNLAFLKGFGSFNEVFNAASTITDSLLNDTGLGGLLPLTSSNASKYRTDLEKNVKDLVGINNSVTYNWEDWFENNLSRNYNAQYYLDNIDQFEPLEKGKEILEAYTKTKNLYPLFDMYSKEEVETTDPETGETTIETIGTYDERFLKEAGFESTEELNDYLQTQSDDDGSYFNEIKELIQNVEQDSKVVADNLKKVEELIQIHNDDIDELDKVLQEESGEDAFVVTINNEEQTINGRFLRSFLEDYLKPRFDTSRSMDEFVEYMDVRQKEKNPFQTEDFASAIRDAGRAASEKYLKEVINPTLGKERSFDYEYYMNPIDTIKKRGSSTIDVDNPPEKYLNQAEIVTRDWEEAKLNPNQLVNKNAPGEPDYGTWAQQAYRYGYDLNNPEHFAKLHFDLLGYKKDGYNFDPAEDYFNAQSIQEFLDGKLTTVLTNRATQVNSVFGRFLTPEEFADEFLIGLDPANIEEYEKALKEVGLEGFKGTLEELKEYIIQNIRTGTAQVIREQIKYLNERRKEPTQEVLGITYIQRPEDYKETGGIADTQLYKFFQDAGYQGSETEFYETFAPDENREDLELIATISDPKGFQFAFGSEEMEDPFTALGTFQTLFPVDEEEDYDSSSSKKEDSGFFDLFGTSDDDNEKSDSAKSFLSEFTSFIKPNVR